MYGWRSDTEKHDDARNYFKDLGLEENQDNEEVEKKLTKDNTKRHTKKNRGGSNQKPISRDKRKWRQRIESGKQNKLKIKKQAKYNQQNANYQKNICSPITSHLEFLRLFAFLIWSCHSVYKPFWEASERMTARSAGDRLVLIK